MPETETRAGLDESGGCLEENSLFPERFVPGKMRGLIEAEHLARYMWASSYAAGHTVLDAGCGVGYGMQILKDTGAASVAGIDIAAEAVQAARRRVGALADVLLGDLASLPFPDGSFELVVCFETIEHLQDQERALDELRRVIGNNGMLLLSSPNRDVYQQGNPHHTHEYTPTELERALTDRFSNVHLVRQQGWLASVVGGDAILTAAGGEVLIDSIHKIASVEPGHETFTLALASDGPLPSRNSLAVLTDFAEFEAWQARARSAENHLERVDRHAREVTAAYESASAAGREARAVNDRLERRLEHVNTLLAERNAALRLAAREMDELHATASQTKHELAAWRNIAEEMQHSPSWRLTAPMRALARMVRRA